MIIDPRTAANRPLRKYRVTPSPASMRGIVSYSLATEYSSPCLKGASTSESTSETVHSESLDRPAINPISPPISHFPKGSVAYARTSPLISSLPDTNGYLTETTSLLSKNETPAPNTIASFVHSYDTPTFKMPVPRISAGCPPLYRMLWQKQAVPSLQTCH